MAKYTRPMHIEGTCEKCHDTVIVDSMDDTEHFVDANGNECGDTIKIEGEWF